MRITQLVLFGIIFSLATATAQGKANDSKDGSSKAASNGNVTKKIASEVAAASSSRTAKSLKPRKSGENRGKRTLYDYANTGYLYPQIAARRGGYSQEGYFNGQNGVAQFPSEYSFNYSPYPQYIEAPEPIIEIIIKDANETLGDVNPQPIVAKSKKKKEKVHVFYVNYKKDENNKLHLESPIASLNNDEPEEEEEEETIEYAVTPLPPVKSTTLRTIIHPDSEKYHSNSGIHVTFGSEDKSQQGHILQEHDAESVIRQVVAVPIPQTGLKTQNNGNARQDFEAHARSPFASNFFQSSSNAQYQPTQQLPSQQTTSFFQIPPQNQQFGHNTHNFYQKSPPLQKSTFNSQQASQVRQQQQTSSFNNGSPSQPQHQPLRKPLAQVQHHIHQQLQQQSQYYVNHNQLYQQQQSQNTPYYNGPSQKPAQSPKQHHVAFPTAPPKTQELPIRQAAQPYQPIKFRPTAAPSPVSTKPTPISTKLENYHSKPYQFQRQPQFVQHPTFTVQSPTVPPPQYYKQQQNYHAQQQQQNHHTQLSNYHSNSQYYAQKKEQLQQPAVQQQQSAVQYNSRPELQSSSGTAPSGLSWLNIKPSRETELLKSIPKFEQHITETIQNNYPKGEYQTKNQVIHDIPAPNLAPQLNHNQYAEQNTYLNGMSNQNQQYSNFVTTSSNLAQAHQVETATQAAQFVQSTDGQKIMVVTPMPPNVYQQYQSAHFPALQGGQQQQPTSVVTSVPSQDQSNNYFQHQQPRQGSTTIQSQSAQTNGNSQFSVSTFHSDVFKELGERKSQEPTPAQNTYIPPGESSNKMSYPALASETTSSTPTPTPAPTPNPKTLLQLPDEVPDDLRQQLLSSGILSNADISVLDYDKVGDIALENLPAEHLQHFYGAGGGAQISASKKVLTVVKPNGDKVSLDEKELHHVKESNHISLKKQSDTKVVRFEGQQQDFSESSSRSGSTERQYNRYLPLKINAANFPRPNVEVLKGKSIQSVVVLAPVDTPTNADGSLVEENKDIKFLGGDLIKTLAKKPTSENFKRWLDKEAGTEVERQSVVLLVARQFNSSDPEIFMYDANTGEVNKLNGELSSKFVNVAEENASAEALERGSTLDTAFLGSMMQKTSS